jgi:hypothetical protein
VVTDTSPDAIIVPAAIPMTLVKIVFPGDEPGRYVIDRYPIVAWRISNHDESIPRPIALHISWAEMLQFRRNLFIELPDDSGLVSFDNNTHFEDLAYCCMSVLR